MLEVGTVYMENLPSPTYKTRQFTKSIKRTLPDDASKEVIQGEFERQQKVCEFFVKSDIDRHIARIEAEE